MDMDSHMPSRIPHMDISVVFDMFFFFSKQSALCSDGLENILGLAKEKAGLNSFGAGQKIRSQNVWAQQFRLPRNVVNFHWC